MGFAEGFCARKSPSAAALQIIATRATIDIVLFFTMHLICSEH
jgi:hypothetical protein